MIIEKDGRYFIMDETGKKTLGKKDGYGTKDEAEKRLSEIELFKSDKTECRVNVRSVLHCNKASISSKMVEGKKHIVIHGAKHMIGDTVMNKILYPSPVMNSLCDNLSNSDAYITAPGGHPVVNGIYVSASDPRSLINHNLGAFHFNFRIENGRLTSDTAISEEVAAMSEDGKKLLEKISKHEDVDISTGFYVRGTPEQGVTSNNEMYEMIANELELDHSAILLHERGAKTSSEGVGLFANGESGKNIRVVECDLSDAVDFDDESVSLITKIRTLFNSENILNADNLINFKNELSLAVNGIQSKGSDDMKEKIIAALTAAGVKIEGLTDDQLLEQYSKLGKNEEDKEEDKDMVEIVNSAMTKVIAPVIARLGDVEKALNSHQDSERDSMIKTVVNHAEYSLTESEAKLLPDAVLSKMAANAKTASNVSGSGFHLNSADSDKFDNMEAPE